MDASSANVTRARFFGLAGSSLASEGRDDEGRERSMFGDLRFPPVGVVVDLGFLRIETGEDEGSILELEVLPATAELRGVAATETISIGGG